MSRIYSSRTVGKLLDADPSSVNRWIDSGQLRAYRTPGGHRRVPHEDLLEFLARCGMPVPQELQPHQQTVLLVDSDRQRMRALRRSLLRAGKELVVDTCASQHQALVLIGARHPDVVLWNLDQAPEAAVDICQSIKGTPETQKVLLILHSEVALGHLKKKLCAQGADAVLLRPFKGAEVVELLKEEG